MQSNSLIKVTGWFPGVIIQDISMTEEAMMVIIFKSELIRSGISYPSVHFLTPDWINSGKTDWWVRLIGFILGNMKPNCMNLTCIKPGSMITLLSFLLCWKYILPLLVLSSHLIISLVLGFMKCGLNQNYWWGLSLWGVLLNAARTEHTQRPEHFSVLVWELVCHFHTGVDVTRSKGTFVWHKK